MFLVGGGVLPLDCNFFNSSFSFQGQIQLGSSKMRFLLVLCLAYAAAAEMAPLHIPKFDGIEGRYIVALKVVHCQ